MLIRRLLLAVALAVPVAVAASAGADTAMVTVNADPPGGDGFSTPPTIGQNSAKLEFTPADPSYTISCQQFPAGTVTTPCTSPFMALNMPEGQNAVRVTVTDSVGSSQTVTTAWLVDTSVPQLTFANAGGGSTPVDIVDIEYNVVDANDQPSAMTMRCTVDGVVVSPCGQPFVARGLSDGQHTLTVTATDPAGHESNTLSRTWLVDTTPPTVSIAKLPVATTAGRASVHWTGMDPGGTGLAGFTVRYRTAKWNGSFGPWTYPAELFRITGTSADLTLAAGTTYCMQAMAFDKVDNDSAWTGSRCVTRALDDKALTLGAGWSRVTAKGFIGGSFVTATKKGASLTLPKATVDRIGVVAMKCASCGSLRVSVGTTTIGTVNLAAPTTSRQLVMLPAFAAKTGQVKLTTLSGKAVRVDGLAATRV